LKNSQGDVITGQPKPQTQLQQEVDRVLNGVRDRRILSPLALHRPRAWERALPPVVTPGDVKDAWRGVVLARDGVQLGADAELFDLRMGDFKLKLEAWLSS